MVLPQRPELEVASYNIQHQVLNPTPDTQTQKLHRYGYREYKIYIYISQSGMNDVVPNTFIRHSSLNGVTEFPCVTSKLHELDAISTGMNHRSICVQRMCGWISIGIFNWSVDDSHVKPVIKTLMAHWADKNNSC